MRSPRPFPLAAFVLLAALVPAADPARGQAGLPPIGFAEGEPFPALVLPSATDGLPVSLADFRGQKLILHIFASW